MVLELTTKVRAIKEAKNLLQSFGFNGFSFQHIADIIGIKKPSLYTHFKSKEELGNDLINDYMGAFAAWAETIDIFEPSDKIGALFEKYYKFSVNGKRFCPVTALISDYNSLPESMTRTLNKMFEFQKQWIKKTIEEGQKKKVFRNDMSSDNLSELVIALGFGSQNIARILNEPNKIKSIKEQALNILRG